MANEIMARLRRSLSSYEGGDDVTDALEEAGGMFIDNLTPEHGALFESVLEPYVRAAEQLGPDAGVPEIVALAKELALRKT
jgi:hypothetical protein